VKASFLCVHLEPDDRIECRTQVTESDPAGYPVLVVGGLHIFPSAVQLSAIQHDVATWLRRQEETAAATAAPAAIC
jgi:hypothetical protein